MFPCNEFDVLHRSCDTDSRQARLYSSEMHTDFTNICQQSTICNVGDIDFSSAKRLKNTLEQKIKTLHQNTGEESKTLEEQCDETFASKGRFIIYGDDRVG